MLVTRVLDFGVPLASGFRKAGMKWKAPVPVVSLLSFTGAAWTDGTIVQLPRLIALGEEQSKCSLCGSVDLYARTAL